MPYSLPTSAYFEEPTWWNGRMCSSSTPFSPAAKRAIAPNSSSSSLTSGMSGTRTMIRLPASASARAFSRMRPVVHARPPLVLLGVDQLEVVEEQVGDREDLLEMAPGNRPAGLHGGVDVPAPAAARAARRQSRGGPAARPRSSVTPPPEFLNTTRSLRISSSRRPHGEGLGRSAPAPGSSRRRRSAPQVMQRARSNRMLPSALRKVAFCSQASTQAAQPAHLPALNMTAGCRSRVSGFWHHRQRRGQPRRKTTVRMPGPSWTQKRWMFET